MIVTVLLRATTIGGRVSLSRTGSCARRRKRGVVPMSRCGSAMMSRPARSSRMRTHLDVVLADDLARAHGAPEHRHRRGVVHLAGHGQALGRRTAAAGHHEGGEAPALAVVGQIADFDRGGASTGTAISMRAADDLDFRVASHAVGLQRLGEVRHDLLLLDDPSRPLDHDAVEAALRPPADAVGARDLHQRRGIEGDAAAWRRRMGDGDVGADPEIVEQVAEPDQAVVDRGLGPQGRGVGRGRRREGGGGQQGGEREGISLSWS